MVSSSLRFPLAVDDVACIRVFALRRQGQFCVVWGLRNLYVHIQRVYDAVGTSDQHPVSACGTCRIRTRY